MNDQGQFHYHKLLMNNTFAKETVRGVFWTYSSYYLGKLLVFISTVILARLLTKSDFGVISFALLLIGLLDAVNGAGISSALIYYQGDEKATHTAFWIDLALGFIIMGATWLIAPFIGKYFDDVRVVQFVKVFAIVFPIAALEDLPKVLLTRNLSFNVQIIPDTLQALVKGITSIFLAWWGLGAWSLAIGQIAGALVSMLAFWTLITWRPKFEFSSNWARAIISYGGGIVATNFLAFVLVNIDYLFVGYYLGAVALGVYTIAFKIPDLLIVQFCSLVGKVIFPVYAKMKEDFGFAEESIFDDHELCSAHYRPHWSRVDAYCKTICISGVYRQVGGSYSGHARNIFICTISIPGIQRISRL
ncbi:MAG: oligosaccharide flippase family protein [Anaerolineales bacterium]